MKCWYCGKRLRANQWCKVVTKTGATRFVCKDDRTCTPKGITGHGPRLSPKRQPKIGKLQKARESIEY